jgi:exosortase/archaeosortase family protein
MIQVISNRGLELAGGCPRWRPVPVVAWLMAALSPVIYWYGLRLDDGSDEPLGLLVLCMAGGLAWRDRAGFSASGRARVGGSALVLVSALAIPWLPPLLRAALGIGGIAVFYGLHRRAGLLGLLWLSLPVAASLQFYLGYPLRLISAEGAVRVLELGGAHVVRTGLEIQIHGKSVGVDPACSGVRMLWHAAVAAMALAAFHRLSWRHSVIAGVLSIGLVVLANTLRACLLVLEEAGPWRGSGLIHAGVGLGCFAVVLVPLWWFAAARARVAGGQMGGGVPTAARAILMLAAVVGPLLAWTTPRNHTPVALGEVPTTFTFDGLTLPLVPLPVTAEERAFAKSFPGQLSSHGWGGRQVILREVQKATRRLHPSRDCLRAAGFETSEAITVVRPDGTRWARFTASRTGERRVVHERVVSLRDGTAWTDVTAWYWHALRRPLNGPWRAETVISR